MTHPRRTPPSFPAAAAPVARRSSAASSPLGAVAVAFAWLGVEPRPVTMDTTAFPGLPNRALPLGELRTQLLSPTCPPQVREAVWAELIRRAHRPHPDGATWTLACAGMALPVLTRVARRLSAQFAGDPTDIHAAVLSGFLHGLASVQPDQPHVLASLRWRAFRSGMTAVREALSAPTPASGPVVDLLTDMSQQSAPAAGIAPSPPGHPDLVLARAVTDGALTRAEAELISSTRLEHVPIAEAARDRGETYPVTYGRRRRAERRLLAYLARPEPSPPDRTDTGRTDTDSSTGKPDIGSRARHHGSASTGRTPHRPPQLPQQPRRQDGDHRGEQP